MDSYVAAYIKVNVHVDAGQRVWCKNEELEVHLVGSKKVVVLPKETNCMQTFTFDDLKRIGARVDVVTLQSLAKLGAEGRWRDEIEERRKVGLPRNVYIANARSIQYSIDKGRTPPLPEYMGRMSSKMTEKRASVDEVIDDMANDRWRTEFSRGRHAKRK